MYIRAPSSSEKHSITINLGEKNARDSVFRLTVISLVADFRRWMMASPSSAAPSSGRRSVVSTWKNPTPGVNGIQREFTTERVHKDPTSIEGVVERLLDPLVSEEEVTDYQR
jgi:hypothetical protein